jgi:hypothetical protein
MSINTDIPTVAIAYNKQARISKIRTAKIIFLLGTTKIIPNPNKETIYKKR